MGVFGYNDGFEGWITSALFFYRRIHGRDGGEQFTEIPGDALTNGNQQYEGGWHTRAVDGLRLEGYVRACFLLLEAALLVLLVLLESVTWGLFGWLGWSWFIRVLCSATGQFLKRGLAVVCLSAGLELPRFQARLFG
jgi:hypothetical protein